jgi:hypothetical protein
MQEKDHEGGKPPNQPPGSSADKRAESVGIEISCLGVASQRLQFYSK